MSEVTIDVEVTCAGCSHELSCSPSRTTGRLVCDPCENCLVNEQKKFYAEGYKEGYEEGRQ